MMQVLLVAAALLAQVVQPAPTPKPKLLDPLTGKPDFSGHWLLTSPPVAALTVGRELVVSQIIETHTIRGDPMPPFLRTLRVTRTFERGVQTDEYQVGMSGGVVGGIPRGGSGTPASPGRSTRFSVTWRDAALSIETGSYVGPRDTGSVTEHDELWSIEATGSLVIVVTDRSSSAEPVTNRLVFRRG